MPKKKNPKKTGNWCYFVFVFQFRDTCAFGLFSPMRRYSIRADANALVSPACAVRAVCRDGEVWSGGLIAAASHLLSSRPLLCPFTACSEESSALNLRIYLFFWFFFFFFGLFAIS